MKYGTWKQNLKVIVELNVNGQGHENGTNLFVRFLGKLSKNPTLCPITIKSWPKMPEDKTCEQWKYIEVIMIVQCKAYLSRFLFSYNMLDLIVGFNNLLRTISYLIMLLAANGL